MENILSIIFEYSGEPDIILETFFTVLPQINPKDFKIATGQSLKDFLITKFEELITYVDFPQSFDILNKYKNIIPPNIYKQLFRMIVEAIKQEIYINLDFSLFQEEILELLLLLKSQGLNLKKELDSLGNEMFSSIESDDLSNNQAFIKFIYENELLDDKILLDKLYELITEESFDKTIIQKIKSILNTGVNINQYHLVDDDRHNNFIKLTQEYGRKFKNDILQLLNQYSL